MRKLKVKANLWLISSFMLLTPLSCSAKTVDLTHVLKANLPNFHIDPNAYRYEKTFSINKDGYANANICTPEHYGTHIDAPSHFVEGAASIDQLSSDDLIVDFVVIDISAQADKNADYMLTLDDIQKFEKKRKIPSNGAVLINTGWSKRWQDNTKYRNADEKGKMHFPGVSLEAAKFLLEKRQIKYLGIDTLSLDPGSSTKYEVHHYALGKGIHLIENLDKLDQTPTRGAKLVCAPLLIENGTGSPARIFAQIK